MKRNLQKVLLITVVIIVFSFSLVKVYAQNTGIDLLSLARNKVLSIANINTSQASIDIQGSRQQVENDILNYVDEYIKGLEDELKDYTNQKKSEVDGKFKTNYSDIKGDLESIRQGVIDEAKQQIDQTIELEYQEQQQILNENLSKKLEEKFK